MTSSKVTSAAAQLQDGSLLVTGGYDQSTLMLTAEGWQTTIPSMPIGVACHCMVSVNSTTVMAIGGYRSDLGGVSGTTFYFTLGKQNWMAGPELKNIRQQLSCGKIKKDKDSQEMSIIVAGGFDLKKVLSSVEILDKGSNQWRTGPELPFGLKDSKMVKDQNGGVVFIGGDSSSTRFLDTLYQLPHGGLDAKWTKMDQKLKIGRAAHTAFLVLDSIVDCS
jgi:hypothetical protein